MRKTQSQTFTSDLDISIGKTRSTKKLSANFAANWIWNPLMPKPWRILATSNSSANNTGEAEVLLKKAIRLQPDVRIAHYDLGIILQEQRKYPAAVQELRKAVALEPGRPDAHYRLVTSLRALGLNSEAEAELKVVRTLHENTTEDAIYKITGPAALKP